MFRFEYLLIALISLATASSRTAQGASPWTVTSLHPTSTWPESLAFGGHGGQQVGAVVGVGDQSHASLWSGSAASWVDLHPAGAAYSYALKATATAQVGFARIGGIGHAGYWTSTAESWVDLSPVDSAGSVAYGTSGIYQVGSASVGGKTRASRWSGSANTWVDLHPAAASSSVAYGEFDGRQVGDVTFVTPGLPLFTQHASLWNGSATSWIDLNPPSAARSIAYGIHGDQQAGWVEVSNGRRASLWSGTAGSWVNLHVPGYSSSEAHDVFDGFQSGFVVDSSGFSRASLWNGTAQSWEDLSLAMIGNWGDTWASSIWRDGDTINVSGAGVDLTTGNEVALLWSRTVPEPNSFLLFTLVGGAMFKPRRRR